MKWDILNKDLIINEFKCKGQWLSIIVKWQRNPLKAGNNATVLVNITGATTSERSVCKKVYNSLQKYLKLCHQGNIFI